MLSRNDIQYPEHARASEPVKGRKIKTDKKAYSNVSPFISASLAGAMMFSYLSSHKLTASADNPSSKPVAAAVTELFFEPFPEIFSEPVSREGKKLHSLPSPEPAPTPVRNLVRVPTPTPEPTPEPIEEYINVSEPVPTPTSSDPEPTPEPTAPEITTNSVVNILITGTNGDNLISSNIRKFSVALNKVLDGKAKVSLMVDKGSGYEQTGEEGIAVYNTDGRTDGTVESGIWSGEVKYTPDQGVAYASHPAKLVMDYELTDGTTDSEELDGFEVYDLSSSVQYDFDPEYRTGSLVFSYPQNLFGESRPPVDSIQSTSLHCETDGGNAVSFNEVGIYSDGDVFVEYNLADENDPERFKYEATVQIEAVYEDGSTTDIQITNKGTIGE